MDKGTRVRTIILGIALLNQFLMAFGFSTIPGTSEEQYLFISTVFTAATAITAWYKNNYITAKGLKQKEVLQKNGLTNAK